MPSRRPLASNPPVTPAPTPERSPGCIAGAAGCSGTGGPFHRRAGGGRPQCRTLWRWRGFVRGLILSNPAAPVVSATTPNCSWFRTLGLTFAEMQPDQKRALAIAARPIEALLPRMAMLFPLAHPDGPRIAPPVGLPPCCLRQCWARVCRCVPPRSRPGSAPLGRGR